VNLSLGAPVSGTIVEINPALELTPEVVNRDPYGEGWLAVIETASLEAERGTLLDPAAYFAAMKQQVAQELSRP
jgi:glycine cleavage system H protein